MFISRITDGGITQKDDKLLVGDKSKGDKIISVSTFLCYMTVKFILYD